MWSLKSWSDLPLPPPPIPTPNGSSWVIKLQLLGFWLLSHLFLLVELLIVLGALRNPYAGNLEI